MAICSSEKNQKMGLGPIFITINFDGDLDLDKLFHIGACYPSSS